MILLVVVALVVMKKEKMRMKDQTIMIGRINTIIIKINAKRKNKILI